MARLSRHFRAPLVAVVAVVALLGCATSGPRVAASVGGVDITEARLDRTVRAVLENKKFQDFLKKNQVDLGTVANVPLATASSVLANLVGQEAYAREVDRRDLDRSSLDRDAVEAQVAEQFGGQAVFDGFPEWFQAEQVDLGVDTQLVISSITPPTDEEALREAFEERKDTYGNVVCVEHILVAARDQADTLRGQLAAGADFATLATANSIDTQSAGQGGQLGCGSENRLPFVEEFNAAVRVLPVGEVSEPVESQFGFHLIRVTSRDPVTFDQVRDQLEAELGQTTSAEDVLALQRKLFAGVTVNPRYGEPRIDDQGFRIVPPSAPELREGSDPTVATTLPGLAPAPG